MIAKVLRNGFSKRSLIKSNRYFLGEDPWKKREEAAEKEYIMKEDKHKLDKLKKKQYQKLMDDADVVHIPYEYDASDVLEARDSLVRILTE